ncbi:junctional adhesion molecule A [Pogoniulus pusillus]|uniref:junctional adhesion molecule A n=1 Tax=Pogoniulus pusillus TaxID=488313 RepID=UPI0030B99C87
MAGAERRGPGVRPRPLLLLLLLGAAVASLVGAQVTTETKEVPEHQSVDIPCAAFRSSAANPRIEWKFQRGNSLLLFYYGKELTEPYRSRVQFSPTSIRLSGASRADSGRYICEVVGEGGDIARSEVTLIVQVPPSKPVAHVPSSGTIGSRAVLRCTETEGSPPPTFRWYKDGILMPTSPKGSSAFRNSSYTQDSTTGELVFEPLSAFDSGEYSCEASNNVGTPQKSDGARLEASEDLLPGAGATCLASAGCCGAALPGTWHRWGYTGAGSARGGWHRSCQAGKG